MKRLELQASLIAHRKQQHWTQADLAERLFLSRQTISNWKNGRTYPDIQSLILLANLYHVTVDDLVKEDLMTMQTQANQHHLKLLVVAAIICLISVYGLFIGLRWLPMIPTIMAMTALTTVGLFLAGYLISEPTSPAQNLSSNRRLSQTPARTPSQTNADTSDSDSNAECSHRLNHRWRSHLVDYNDHSAVVLVTSKKSLRQTPDSFLRTCLYSRNVRPKAAGSA